MTLPTIGRALEILRAVTYLGVPAAIALWLVYVGAAELPRIRILSETNAQQLATLQQQQREHERTDQEIRRLLQRVCSNTARTADDRERCFTN